MTFKPDYGLGLLRQGYRRQVAVAFYDCRLLNLMILGAGQYSTTVDCPLAGDMHALSLDFTGEQLEQILSKASPQLSMLLHDEITRDPCTPRTIDFEGEVPFGVRAHLGELQEAEYESFVPLVAEEILSSTQS